MKNISQNKAHRLGKTPVFFIFRQEIFLMSQTGIVYVLCFDEPFHHARHYIGFTSKDVFERFREHASGHGAKLMAAVSQAQIGFTVCKTFPGQSRKFERQIKKQKNGWKHCPKCRASRGLPAERQYRN